MNFDRASWTAIGARKILAVLIAGVLWLGPAAAEARQQSANSQAGQAAQQNVRCERACQQSGAAFRATILRFHCGYARDATRFLGPRAH